MTVPQYQRKPLPFLLLQTLYRPAILISLVLHAVFVMLPVADSSMSVSEDEPRPEETISLAHLLASPSPSRAAAPQPQPQASPLPAKPVATNLTTPPLPPPPPAVAPPAPAASPQPAESPAPAPSASPEAIASPAPTPTPAPSPQPEENSARVQTFFEQLAATASTPVNSPSPDLFSDPTLYFESTESESVLKPDILRAVWMDGKTPQQVYISVLNSQFQSGNFQTSQKPDYGGGTVYEIRQGEAIWYLNLVPTADGNGTVIVVWNRDPSRPASN